MQMLDLHEVSDNFANACSVYWHAYVLEHICFAAVMICEVITTAWMLSCVQSHSFVIIRYYYVLVCVLACSYCC